MKKTKVISILALASTFAMAGCGENPKPDCSHVDDNKDHLCDKCGEKVSDHEAAAEWKHDATNHWHVCSYGGCDVVLDKAAHSFGEWSVVTPATFEKDGVEHRVCACGYEETRPIAKLQHNFSSDWSKDAEKHWHACTDAGYEGLKSDEAAHSFGDWSEKSPADFEHKKVEHRFCSVCGHEEEREVGEVLPHNYSSEWSKDAEKHWHACIDVGYESLKSDEAAHSFGEWLEKSPADFEHKKVEHRFCLVCGHEEEREVGEVLPHNYSSEWSNDNNTHWHACTDEGYENLKKDVAMHLDTNADHLCDVCEHKMTEHNFSDVWSNDETNHWHDCEFEGCDEVSDLAAHVDTNKDHLCDDCEYKMTEHDFSDAWSNDETNHWHDCEFEGCDEVSGLAAHVDDDKDHKCDVCEYVMSEHSFSEDWSNDASNHWHDCEFEGCDEVSGLVAHADDNNDHLCDVCEYKMSEHDFEDTWSHANGQHFHKCSFEGCDEIAHAADHVDNDVDGYCDVCNEVMPAVNSVTLDYITGYIGAGESVLLTAVVDATGDAPTDVEWHLEKSNGASWTKAAYSSWDVTDVFTLVDNKDGTATLSGVMMEYTAEFSCYVYATSKFDDSVSSNKTEKIYYQTWNNTKRGTLNDFFGDGQWQTIPFFPTTTLSLSSDGVKLTGKSTARTIAQMINSFDNQGTWTKVSASSTTATYTLVDGYANYECVISKNTSSTSYGQFVVTKSYSIPEEFLGTFSFVAHDDYGNVDMPVLVNVTSDGATFIAYASDGIYEHKCAVSEAVEGKVSFAQGTSYSDLKFTLVSDYELISLVSISGSWFDGYTWSATLPATLSTDALRIVVDDDSIQNGSITITSDGGTFLAPVGAAVEFQVTAAKGYEIDTVTLSESGVELKELYGGKYSFVMPDADVVISATFKEKEIAPVDWNTLSGDCGTLSSPLKINNGWGGTINLVLDFNSGTISSYEKNNQANTLVVMTSDSTGCGLNQLHLTGLEENWNGLSYDFIIEYDSDNSKIVLVAGSDKTICVW